MKNKCNLNKELVNKTIDKMAYYIVIKILM